MKRKLWIILAFLVVLASLCFGAAQAAGTYTSTPVSMRFSFFQWDDLFCPTQDPEITWEDRAPDIGEGIMPFQSQDHHFKWWFDNAPIRGKYLRPPKGGVSKACYWPPHDRATL